MTRFNDFGEPKGTHDFADVNRGHVLRDICHPDAQGGVDGKHFDTAKGLAILQDRQRYLGELEIRRSDEPFRMSGEFPLSISVGHENLRDKE
jgi:hypothetical protein